MPFNGSGVFNRDRGPDTWKSDATAGVKIKADLHDISDNDIASGLSMMICKDGQSGPIADINWNGYKITNLSPGVAPTDAVNFSQLGSIRSFGTGITMSGAGLNTRLEYPQADMSFFVRSIGDPAVGDTAPRFVWNDKADGTGTDIAKLNDTGTLTVSGDVTSGYGFISSTTNCILAATGAGGIIFRPNGRDATAGQAYITTAGDMNVAGGVTSGGNLHSGGGRITGANPIIIAPSSAGTMYLRPNGQDNSAGAVTIDTSGSIATAGWITAGGNATIAGNITAGGIVSNGNVHAMGAGSTMYMGAGGTGRIFHFQSGWYWDWTSADGTLTWRGAGGHSHGFHTNGNFAISGPTGVKAAGTTWANPSDARIKTVTGDYETGLAEILQLQPRTFTYKGNYTSEAEGQSPYAQMAADATEVAGFVAQEVEEIMPAMVTQGEGYIDGEKVTDFRTLDTSNLILALVNAVKELSAKVEALEAAR